MRIQSRLSRTGDFSPAPGFYAGFLAMIAYRTNPITIRFTRKKNKISTGIQRVSSMHIWSRLRQRIYGQEHAVSPMCTWSKLMPLSAQQKKISFMHIRKKINDGCKHMMSPKYKKKYLLEHRGFPPCTHEVDIEQVEPVPVPKVSSRTHMHGQVRDRHHPHAWFLIHIWEKKRTSQHCRQNKYLLKAWRFPHAYTK